MPGFLNSIITDARARPALDRRGPWVTDNGQGGMQNGEPAMAATSPAQAMAGDKPILPVTADKPAVQHETQPSTLSDTKSAIPPIRREQVSPRSKKSHQADTATVSSVLTVEPDESLSATPVQETNSVTKKTIDLNQAISDGPEQSQSPQGTPSQPSRRIFTTVEASLADKANVSTNKTSTHAQTVTANKMTSEGKTLSSSLSRPKVMKLADTLIGQSESLPEMASVNDMVKHEAAMEQKTDPQGEEESSPHYADVLTTVHEAEKMHDSEAASSGTDLNLSFAVPVTDDAPWYDRPIEKEEQPVSSGSENSAGVHIGQIDIIVQTESKQTVIPRTVQPEQSGFSSRYYLRRL